MRLRPLCGVAPWWVSLTIRRGVKPLLPPVESRLFSRLLFCPICATNTSSSINPEVHNISQRGGEWSYGHVSMHKKLEPYYSFGSMLANRQTRRLTRRHMEGTNRHAYHNTPLPTGKRKTKSNAKSLGLTYTQGEITSHNLWSRYARHFVGITRHYVCS